MRDQFHNDIIFTQFNHSRSTSVTVRRVERPEVWVTLPGDNQSHKLTEQQAKELLRKLEEVV